MDAGVSDGSVVSPWYDPMLAKVIAYAPTRSKLHVLSRLLLRGLELHGITTNRDLLVHILRDPEFVARRDRHRLPRPPRPAELGAPIASDEAGVTPRGSRRSCRVTSSEALGREGARWPAFGVAEQLL